MKKGCFIKTVIFVSILIAAIVYLVENKLNDWIVRLGKKILLNEIVNKCKNEFKYIHTSAQKDSLKSLLNYFVVNIDSLNEVTGNNVKSFATEFNSAIEDSVISNDELSILTLLVKEEINEKSKSN